MASGNPILYFEGSDLFPRWDQQSDAMKADMLKAWGEGQLGASVNFTRTDNDEKKIGRAVGMVVDFKVDPFHPTRVGIVLKWIPGVEAGMFHG
jgi:hypothetical protein